MAASSKRLGGEQTSAVVTMNIYSGRPDPKWTLSQADLATLLTRLDALPEARGEAPASHAALGYRGLSVTFSGGAAAEFGAGRITLDGGASLVDDKRALERWLVETGRAQIDGRAVETALGRIDKGN